ncbi:MAG: hypothetical protein KIT87_13920 [Anaerolineae bacterium]|nr:hypothetical protein [Anaerolineae bacterium]
MRPTLSLASPARSSRALAALALHSTALWLIALTLLGLALRLYRLGDVPAGMHPDEAHYALDAVAIMGGWRPVFLPANNGREPLFVYLMAWLFNWLGPTVWTARFAGAVVGTLMVPVQYLFVRRLPLPRPTQTALISAFLIAVTFWPVSQSHQALRAGLLPAEAALVFWAWWETLRETPTGTARWRAPTYAALTGILLAMALWTHLSARLLPGVMVGFAIWVAWRRRDWRPLGWLLVALALAALLVSPLALYFVQNPDMLGYRANQVSVLNPEVNKGDLVGTLLTNAWRIALMVNVRGTTSWLENLRGRPVFDPLIGLAFLVGVVYWGLAMLGRRGRDAQAASVLLLLGLLAMLAPSWLSAGAPSYGRLNGAWAVLFLMPAWGLERGMAALEAQGRSRLGKTALSATLCLSAIWSAYDFFVVYAQSPDVYDVYFGPVRETGELLASLAAREAVYVTPEVWQRSVIRFTTVQRPPGVFDPTAGLVLPPTGDPVYAFYGTEAAAAQAFAQRWSQSTRQDYSNPAGALLLVAFQMPRAAWPTPANLARLPDFGEYIRLEAYETPQGVARGKALPITLQWLALQPTPLDHNLFIRVVAANGREIGQFDGPPLGGSYPTTVWRPDERIWQTIQVPIARDAPVGAARVRLGWYDWRDGRRLPVAGATDSAVGLGTIQIGE